ncbi:MAG: alpha-amylase family glycosyl hydrolase [Anaerolineae bacterium]
MRIPRSMRWVPEWARSAIIYHIYPLGFLDAPQRNPGYGAPVHRLRGVHKWLDHIAGLGVTTIQFGPVFESHSHGYNTIDFFQIDRRLGDLLSFRELVDAIHGRGMRVILDGVFNHSGRGFFAFRDVVQHGRESRFADWFKINWEGQSPLGDPFDYEGWNGFHSLPLLNLSNPETRSHLFDVARYWIKEIHVDGWRLDVAHELPVDFLRDLRRAIKQANPESLMFGEMVHGDYRNWIAPDLCDCGTDYQLYAVLWRAFIEGSFENLFEQLQREYDLEMGAYRDLTLVNFLGNHDVTRILSQLDRPEHIYPAMMLLMMLPGIPAIYYGDELGLTGHKDDGDQSLRGPMPQEPVKSDIYTALAQLGRLRHRLNAVTHGRFVPLQATDKLLAMLYEIRDEDVIVLINQSEDHLPITLDLSRQGISDGTTFEDVLNSGWYTVEEQTLTVDPVWRLWGRILVRR